MVLTTQLLYYNVCQEWQLIRIALSVKYRLSVLTKERLDLLCLEKYSPL